MYHPTGQPPQAGLREGHRQGLDIYRFALGLALRNGDDALAVNGCELSTTDEKGKVLYHNAVISNHPLDADNVESIL